MLCVYCGETFKLSTFCKDKNVCPECSGEVDDMSIPDEELNIVLFALRNPGGRTKAHFEFEDDE